MARACVFCGDGPVTREHVFPQWLKKLPVPTELLKLTLVPQPVERSRTVFDEDGRYVTVIDVLGGRKPLPTHVEVKVVCGGCNNGWMSDLEDEVIPILTKLALKKAHKLSADEQAVLARWHVKTALMYAFWDPAATPFTPRVYRNFYQTREVPKGAMVWMTRSESQWADMAMSMRNMRASLHTRPDIDRGNNSTAMYLGVNGVAFLVHYSRVLDNLHLVLPEPWDGGWIRLHPAPDDVQWPQKAMKETRLLDTISFMGSEEDLTAGVNIDGHTPDELVRIGATQFVDKLIAGSGYDPDTFRNGAFSVIQPGAFSIGDDVMPPPRT